MIKQYTQLFSLDGVKLEFTSEALKAVAEKTLKRNTGARGLRSVMEELLTQLMYEVPSDPTIEKIVITGDCVTQNAKPEIVVNPGEKNEPAEGSDEKPHDTPQGDSLTGETAGGKGISLTAGTLVPAAFLSGRRIPVSRL